MGLQHATFGYLSFNFGFGAGVVINGEPLFGAFGNAGEISRIYTEDELPLRTALGELLKILRKNGIQLESVSQLRQTYSPDWLGLNEWIDQVTPHLSRAINALRGVIDPSAIVIGGEIPKALAERLLLSLHAYHSALPRDCSVHPDILISNIEGDAAVFGASLLPIRDTFF